MLDFKYKDYISTTIVEKFKVFLEMQDLMFFEMRETLKNDLKEMLVKSEISETKDKEHCGSREVWQEEKDLGLQSFSNKEKTIKASREEETQMDEGVVLTLAADPPASATLEVSKQWGDIFNILRENGFGPEFLCEVKLAFKYDDEMKTFSDLQSLRQFTSQKPVIRELLNHMLQQKEKTNLGGGYGLFVKGGNALVNSKHEAGGTASDGLHFLFTKEVKVARPEVKNLETWEEEFSEWKDKGIPTFEVTGEDSETHKEDIFYVRAEEEEGACAMEEEEEWWEEEEEGEDDSILCEKRDSTCRLVPATSVMGKMGADEEIMVFSKVRNSEKEEEEEVGGFSMLKTLQTQTSKEADLIQEKEKNFRTTVMGVLREMGEEIGKIKKCLPDILETKNSIDDLRSRIDILEERLCNLDDETHNSLRIS